MQLCQIVVAFKQTHYDKRFSAVIAIGLALNILLNLRTSSDTGSDFVCLVFLFGLS